MTWPIAVVVVGTLWAAVALFAAHLWSRVKIAELATLLTRLRLEHAASETARDIPEVEL